MEYSRNNFSISDDRKKVDVEMVHAFLTRSYWAKGIPVDVVRRCVDRSLCFSVFDNASQIGFARIISDCATFAYLADVFILDSYRGRGLSKWLMDCIIRHPDLQGLRRWMLFAKKRHQDISKQPDSTTKQIP